MRNRRWAQMVSLLMVLLMLAGCSAPAEPETSGQPEASGNTFTASEPAAEEPAGEEPSSEAGEQNQDDAIALTQAALAENDWINLESPEGLIGMPSNEDFLTAMQFKDWKSVADVADFSEAFRFAVGTGEIIIGEGAAYLMTDHGMDWYEIPVEVIGNVMAYMEEHFTMSARSMLANDEFMFQEYYYDTIASIGNMEDLDGQGPLHYEMVKYAWFRYCYENDEATIKALYDEDLSGYLFTSEMALREAKRYFDYDEATTDLAEVNFYLPDVDGFEFWYSGPETREGFSNGWGVAYGGMKDLGDERYEVSLISYADSGQSRIDCINIYEIAFDDEGNLKFDRAYQERPTYNLADAAPDFDKLVIEREYEYMGGRLVGESAGAYYFMDDSEDWLNYNRLDKDSLKMTSISIPNLGDEYEYRIEQRGDEFFFYTSKRVIIGDEDWNFVESVDYPEDLKMALNDYYENYGESVYFGESMSTDRSMFVYVDGDGMKLSTVATGQTELIKPKEGEGDVYESIWCMNPRFVNDDAMILTSLTRDYDSGFYLYDLKTKEEKTFEGYIIWEPWQISDGRGCFISDKVNGYFYDFSTGEIRDLPVENRGPDVSMDNYLLCNDKYAAYFDQGEEGKELVLLNLDAWTVEKRASIANMDANLLFLGDNGNVGIHYFFTYDNTGDAILRNK